MEKRQDLFINGGMRVRLPIGFRFCPTDEELLVHYLKRKALSVPLPAPIIPDFNVFNTAPWALPGDLEEKRHFFWKRKCSSKIKATSFGYWKFNGKGKLIVASGSSQAVGMRKKLGFYTGKHPHGTRTCWVMHQFHLLESTSSQNPFDQVGEWVVCLVFQRKRRPRSHGIGSKGERNSNLGNDCRSFIDFKMEGRFDLGPPEPYSPCASDLTDELDQIEKDACV